MKKASIILVFALCVMPVFADDGTFELLQKQNDFQVKMNQYEANKQLNEQKIKIIQEVNGLGGVNGATMYQNPPTRLQNRGKNQNYGYER